MMKQAELLNLQEAHINIEMCTLIKRELLWE